MRIAIALLLALVFLVLLLLATLLADQAYQAWRHLQEAPDWLVYTFTGLLLLLSLGFGLAVRALLFPRRRRPPPPQEERVVADEGELRTAIEQAEERGVDVAEVQAELAELEERRAVDEVQVAFFGEISAGKSSLIRALAAGAEPAVDVRGGTTRTLDRYRWEPAEAGPLLLVDMPGLNEANGELDELSREEALRSHAVVYVCDSDLTASQHAELRALLRLEKPTILAVNKTDQYSAADLAAIRARLQELASGSFEVVTVSGGGERELLRILPDGREETVVRRLPPRVEELRAALLRVLAQDRGELGDLRDRAVYTLANRKLEAAVADHRRRESERIVESYTKRAVAGALAAITPGSDLIIQGFLATRLVRDLGELYAVPIRHADTELLMELVQAQVGKSATLFLAVAGNALKAFPGIGTLAGAVAHAVAYGLIFNALGHAVARALEAGGGLQPRRAAELFTETPRNELEKLTRKLAEMALAEVRGGSDRRPG